MEMKKTQNDFIEKEGKRLETAFTLSHSVNRLRSTPSRMKKPLTRGAFYLGLFHLPG
jgi:hypothetical protein